MSGHSLSLDQVYSGPVYNTRTAEEPGLSSVYFPLVLWKMFEEILGIANVQVVIS